MNKLLVYHDGACPVCREEISVMRWLDWRGAMKFVDLTRAHVSACLIDPATMLARFTASKNGNLVSGAAAFAAMWRAIPMLRLFGLAAFQCVCVRLHRVRLRRQPAFADRRRP